MLPVSDSVQNVVDDRGDVVCVLGDALGGEGPAHELAYAVVARGVHRDHRGPLEFKRYSDVIDHEDPVPFRRERPEITVKSSDVGGAHDRPESAFTGVGVLRAVVHGHLALHRREQLPRWAVSPQLRVGEVRVVKGREGGIHLVSFGLFVAESRAQQC